MSTTTVRKRSTRPMSYYWSVVKDMDDSQKKQLVMMLVDSVRPAKAGDGKKSPLDARDYAGIWTDDEYMDADELVDTIHNARHFKDRAKFWDE